MKKLLLAVLLLAATCGIAFGAEQITADEAFRMASQPTGDPVVGVWRMHYTMDNMRGSVAHLAIVPNSTDKREGWAYLGIMLEEGFHRAKGDICMALRQTDVSYIYDVVIVTKGDVLRAFDSEGAGVAFLLNGNVLDMARVTAAFQSGLFTSNLDRYAPITHMVKVKDFQMKFDKELPPSSGLAFDGLRVSAVESGSMAEKAGLKPGDVVVEVNGKPADKATLKDLDVRLTTGRTIVITYERGGNRDIATLKMK